jgi:hypothetical protein
MTVNLELVDFIDALLEVLEGAALVILFAVMALLHKRLKQLEDQYDYFARLARIYGASGADPRAIERQNGRAPTIDDLASKHQVDRLPYGVYSEDSQQPTV